jgi:hypothetical protein
MQRVQRKRTKGWEMPPNTAYVGRPTKWGNPFRAIFDKDALDLDRDDIENSGTWWVVDNEGNYWRSHTTKESAIAQCVKLYSSYLEAKLTIGQLNLNEIIGKNLACFCKIDEPCHADVLIEFCNAKSNHINQPLPCLK